MERLYFNKVGKWWVSNVLQGGCSYGLRLELPEKCNIVVESNYMPGEGEWAPQYNQPYAGGAWEKNVTNIPEGQSIRVLCTVQPKAGYFKQY